MSGVGSEWCRWRLLASTFIGLLVVALLSVSAQSSLKHEATTESKNDQADPNHVIKISSPKSRSSYKHIWPDIKFGWKIVVGAIIGFFGAACGSVGGDGGGGIFLPMLNLIVGFDAKSSIALSRCMITGVAASTFVYNLRQRHPTLDIPIIDYDLALLFQPMLVLGISIGVAFNVIFADWMITILLIVLLIVMSTKAFLKGVESWKKETITKREAARCLELNEEFKFEPESLSNDTTPEKTEEPRKSEVSIMQNIYWKELGLLVAVWAVVLALQIAKNYEVTCSVVYWVLNFLQIPVAGAVSAYEAIAL
ncbi:hypothetical protein CISIN_1g0454882mg, partial [Citrus sinensis]